MLIKGFVSQARGSDAETGSLATCPSFQPSGFNRLFGIPVTELTDAAYDAHELLR
jgi:hypothetical protein